MHLGVGDGYLFDLRLQFMHVLSERWHFELPLKIIIMEIQVGNLKNKPVLMPLTSLCDKSTHVVESS